VNAREPLSEELLSAYLDGECRPDERAVVAARLERDADWRRIFDDVAAARSAVRSLPWAEAPPGFLEAMTHPPPRPGWSRPARYAAIVAAAAAIGVGFAIAAPSDPDTRVTPEIATLADSHGAAAALESDPISTLAPLAVPIEGRP
jgi:anti-sigma factor RsiW